MKADVWVMGGNKICVTCIVGDGDPTRERSSVAFETDDLAKEVAEKILALVAERAGQTGGKESP